MHQPGDSKPGVVADRGSDQRIAGDKEYVDRNVSGLKPTPAADEVAASTLTSTNGENLMFLWSAICSTPMLDRVASVLPSVPSVESNKSFRES